MRMGIGVVNVQYVQLQYVLKVAPIGMQTNVSPFYLVSKDWYQFTVRDASNMVSHCFM